ncbi:MAG: branched-chain amino acid aminotransferase [Bacillota bacterium]|uniref:branched-chain amino acid aminotransferase n=1 Tax=Desulfurispora thermophila TaxID=265470 RepID=UPI000371DDB7|nr:branched-chain amino acid aminotransferase [Desulfurispora thermophila]
MLVEILVKKVTTGKPKPADDRLGFGINFTDHMFVMDYNTEAGWHNPRIEPYGPLSLDPSTMVFHYGQAIFEGIKAYRRVDGRIGIFRPRDYIARMNRSADRLCIPPVDETLVLKALKELIRLEQDWVPRSKETSLYIRPFIIATDPFLGVRPSFTYKFMIILSPVGAYYPEGFNAVKIMVTDQYVRAVRGGLGHVKTPGNYAASLKAAEEAKKQKYTQVLWLDGVELKYIEEVGTMNIFFVIDGEVVTPPLEGSILGGMTRDSVLTVTREWGLRVSERRLSIDEVVAAADAGRLQEIFGTGTAAVISPVNELKYKDKIIVPGDGQVGPLSHKLYDYITGLQYGTQPDKYGWVEYID